MIFIPIVSYAIEFGWFRIYTFGPERTSQLYTCILNGQYYVSNVSKILLRTNPKVNSGLLLPYFPFVVFPPSIAQSIFLSSVHSIPSSACQVLWPLSPKYILKVSTSLSLHHDLSPGHHWFLPGPLQWSPTWRPASILVFSQFLLYRETRMIS